MRPRSLEAKIEVTQAFDDRVTPLLENGSVRGVVDSIFDWRDVRRATERMERNENVGKIVLRVRS